MSRVVFQVEQAGCASCAERVRSALQTLAPVPAVQIDAATDAATVHMDAPPSLSEDTVATTLAKASQGSGHAYRLRPGSSQPEA